MNYYNDNKQALSDLISDLENDNGISIIAKEDVESELDYANKCHKLEKQLCCPLDVFAKLTLGRKIWVEVEGMKCYEGNHYAEVDNSFDVNEDDWGETEFWAWYRYCCNGSDHVELKLNEYGTKWWLKKDKSE